MLTWSPHTRINDSWTVRELPPRPYGVCLSGILSELAMMCLYGDPEALAPIVLSCESMFVTVLPLRSHPAADSVIVSLRIAAAGPEKRPSEAK